MIGFDQVVLKVLVLGPWHVTDFLDQNDELKSPFEEVKNGGLGKEMSNLCNLWP